MNFLYKSVGAYIVYVLSVYLSGIAGSIKDCLALLDNWDVTHLCFWEGSGVGKEASNGFI